ncbi:MAG: carboxypeptidase regulatory-like domain-containing protein [Bryobacteraceae bacterium]|nr:carboxypeptidase regulatory-like domain-containing protein [Bryobacteraceae bacterium]
MKIVVKLAALAAIAACAFSQTAQVTGTVTDPTGAVVPGAKVTAANVNTGVARDSVTNDAGNYLITALLPGRYTVTAEAAGFKQLRREQINLAVDQIGRIDFVMEVGGLQESVTVEASAVLLDSATSTVGMVVENQRVTELPLNGRNPLDLLALSPGIRVQGGFGGKTGALNWGNFSSNGGLANSNSVLVEGLALDMAQMNSPSFVPPVDATEEFRVQTNKFSAEFGRTGGAIVNFSIKSGTNQLHGSAYEFLRNKVLNANNFFLNRAGRDRPAFIQNQFGASLGGPIKRDKTFFFFNWEEYRLRQPSPAITTVPTAQQRTGDFSQTFNSAGRMVVVADPLTTTQQANGSFARDPFPGNVIPAARLSTVAGNVSRIWPAPNAPGNALTNVNNFSTLGGTGNNEHQVVTKLDHNLSSRWKFFGTYSRTWAKQFNIDPLGYTPNLTRDASYARTHTTVSATAVFSPSLIGEFRSGFARFHAPSIPYALGFDMTTLGFPRELAEATQIQSFPAFNIAGLVAVGSTASAGLTLVDLNSWGQRASMTWVKSAHSLKLGADYRVQQLNQFQSNSLVPAFQFNSQMTAINPRALNQDSGVPYASFLLGNMASASVAKSERLANQRKFLALYVQDDWKVTRKLTLNLGLDYSLEFPITERYNRKMWFDPDAELPISAQVGLPLRGGFRFADGSTRSPYDLYARQFGPRFGFAYQLFSRTVVRSGYGLFWIPAALTEVTGDNRAPAWAINTLAVPSLDGGLTPYHTLDNPYPDGILNPPGSQAGLNTLIGQNGAANLRSFRSGYMQQWNFDIQHELGREMVLEVLYAGSSGTGLPAQWASQMNQLADAHLAQGSALQQPVPNPFYGLVQAGPLAQPNVQRGQLLRPFPQFQTLYVEGMPLGHSSYHSFQLQFNKRFGSSVVGLAYTLSKAIGNTESRSDWLEGGAQGTSMGFLNNNNRRLDRALAIADVPHRLVASFSLDLPFGRGRRLLSGAGPVDRLVSGWQLTGVYTAQSGTPVAVGSNTNLTGAFNDVTDVYGSYSSNARPDNNGQSAKLSGSAHDRLNRWFDTSVFSTPPAFAFGTAPRTLPDARWHGTNNLDFGLFKNNRFGTDGRYNVQFRAEAFNAFNRVRFGVAGIRHDDAANFGVIGSQGNIPRQLQLALKFLF